jgi:hypothetical protein
MTFVFEPCQGFRPLILGMAKSQVLEVLGPPDLSRSDYDCWGPVSELQVGYNAALRVDHIGMGPGRYGIQLGNCTIWGGGREVAEDPNIELLKMDQYPVVCLGFLVFLQLGIASSGFHDDNSSQYAIRAFPKGSWDKYLKRAKQFNADKYHST